MAKKHKNARQDLQQKACLQEHSVHIAFHHCQQQDVAILDVSSLSLSSDIGTKIIREEQDQEKAHWHHTRLQKKVCTTNHQEMTLCKQEHFNGKEAAKKRVSYHPTLADLAVSTDAELQRELAPCTMCGHWCNTIHSSSQATTGTSTTGH
jgi:hypothetical protein